jgi:hypothetical protein
MNGLKSFTATEKAKRPIRFQQRCYAGIQKSREGTAARCPSSWRA